MSASRKPPQMPIDEFLDWDEGQEAPHEFDGERIIEITAVTANHSTININLVGALRTCLSNSPCGVFASPMHISAGAGVRCPDAFVVYGPISGRTRVIGNPVVIFEILSDSTAGVDLHEKVREYRRIPSLRRYVIVEQNEIAATVWQREPDGWVARTVHETAILDMPEINASIPLADLYEGVDFSEPAATS